MRLALAVVVCKSWAEPVCVTTSKKVNGISIRYLQ